MTEQKLRWVSYQIPDNLEFLAAFGEVSIRHTHLDHTLRKLLEILSEVSLQEARDATVYETSSSLRERVKKLARQALGEGAPLIKVQALMERCKRATTKRNELTHNVIAADVDASGELIAGGNDGSWGEIPSVEDLKNLSQELLALQWEIIDAMVGHHSYISDGLRERRKALKAHKN